MVMPFLDNHVARHPQQFAPTCPTPPHISGPYVPAGLGPACWSLKAHRPRHKRHRIFDQDLVILKASLHRAAAASYSGSPEDFQQQGFQQQGPKAELDSSYYAQASGGDAPSARQGSSRQQGASGSSSSSSGGGSSGSGPGSYRPDPYGPAAGTVVSFQTEQKCFLSLPCLIICKSWSGTLLFWQVWIFSRLGTPTPIA